MKLAVKAGFRSIYHCTYADEEALDLLESVKDTAFVSPAAGIIYANIHEGEEFGITPEVAQKMGSPASFEGMQSIYPELRKRGVRALIGGDYGFPNNPIGRNARDLELFVTYLGYSPAEALVAATQHGGQLMGMGDELGLLKAGYLADVLVVKGDPTADVTVLQDADNIAYILQNGALLQVARGGVTEPDRSVDGVAIHRDVVHTRVEGYRPLALDLYLPDAGAAAVCVYAHGGGWRVGSRRNGPGPLSPTSGQWLARMAQRGSRGRGGRLPVLRRGPVPRAVRRHRGRDPAGCAAIPPSRRRGCPSSRSECRPEDCSRRSRRSTPSSTSAPAPSGTPCPTSRRCRPTRRPWVARSTRRASRARSCSSAAVPPTCPSSRGLRVPSTRCTRERRRSCWCTAATTISSPRTRASGCATRSPPRACRTSSSSSTATGTCSPGCPTTRSRRYVDRTTDFLLAHAR